MDIQKSFDQYISYAEEKGWSAGTVKDRKNLLDRLLEYLRNKEFTLENVLGFRTELYKTWKTPQSRRSLTNNLRALVNWLAFYEYIEKSFASKIEKPYIPGRPDFDYIEPEIVRKLIEVATEPKPFVFGKSGDNPRNKKIKLEMREGLEFMLFTGLRVSELLKLKGSDFIMSKSPSFWVASKGKKQNEKDLLPLPIEFLPMIEARRKKERVFEVTEDGLNDCLKRGVKLMNLDAKLTCQSLRHIYATSLTIQGLPIQKISRLLRHTNIKTTMDYYLHFQLEDLAFVANNQTALRGTAPIEQRMKLLEEAIENTGITEDPRFLVNRVHLPSGGYRLEVLLR